MSTLGPLEFERRCSLFLSSVFAAVGFSVGLNALIKANQEWSYIDRLAVPYGIVHVSIHDVFTTGAIIIAVCALLTVLSGVFCVLTWHPVEYKLSSFRTQSWALLFCATSLFATLVTYDYFFVNRSAQVWVTVTLHGQRAEPEPEPEPEPVVQHPADSLDFTYAYRDVYFLRLLAVLPWFAFILAVVAGVVLRFAAKRAAASASKRRTGRQV